MREDPLSSENRKLSLLLLGTQMAVGGAQVLLLSKANWFHLHGYRVCVAFLYDKEGLHESWQAQYPFPIYNLRARKLGTGFLANLFHLLGGLGRTIKLLCSEKYDAIETFTHHSNLIGIPFAWIAGVPVRVASNHGRIYNFPRLLERVHAMMINVGLATCLVAVSEEVRKASIKEGVNPERIVTIPNGISLPELDKAIRRRIRTEMKVKEGDQLILSVGRLTYEKGHTFLIQAIPEVLERHPDTVFALAGEGILRSGLKAEARQLSISERVHFLGFRQDILELMAAADIFVLPSRSEGLPIALLEAMGMGMAIVASNVGGVGELVKDGIDGLLVPPEDPVELAKALNRFVKDRNARRRMALAGQQKIKREYTSERMCDRYAVLYTGQSIGRLNGF